MGLFLDFQPQAPLVSNNLQKDGILWVCCLCSIF